MIHTALCKWSVLSRDPWTWRGIVFDPSYYTVHRKPTPLDKCVGLESYARGAGKEPPPEGIVCRISRWVDRHRLLAVCGLVAGLIGVRWMGGGDG